ncbi:MAG TPA: pilin [Patescibacteria group bacterium]|nr:pilin [Patescibacteria group bacterium]
MAKNLPTIDVSMRKFLTPIFVTAATLLAPQAYAQGIKINTCPGGNFSALCLGASDLGKVITNGINFLFVVAAMLALVFLVLGGVKWLTSQGEKEGVNKARETIVAAIVGLVIIFLSYLIVNFVLNLFAGVSLFNLTLPTLTR